jgi:hypothetical protein
MSLIRNNNMQKAKSWVSVDSHFDPNDNPSHERTKSELKKAKTWTTKKRPRERTPCTDFWTGAGIFFISVVIGILMGHFVFPLKPAAIRGSGTTPAPVTVTHITSNGTTQTTPTTPAPAPVNVELSGICRFNKALEGAVQVEVSSDGLLTVSSDEDIPENGVLAHYVPYTMSILKKHSDLLKCLDGVDVKDDILIKDAAKVKMNAVSSTEVAAAVIPNPKITVTTSIAGHVMFLDFTDEAATLAKDCCIIGIRKN